MKLRNDRQPSDRATRRHDSQATEEQYSLRKILAIWALAAVPMGLLGWVAFPLIAPDEGDDPLRRGVIRISLFTIGLIWQFVLAMIIVDREEGDLRWKTIKRRLRLVPPSRPDGEGRTNGSRHSLWWWVIVFVAGAAVMDIALAETIDDSWVSIFPFFAEPSGYGFDSIFDSQEILDSLVGAWWFLALFIVFAFFNTFGEELLFRGVLLPRMEGAFGRWAWVANGALFAVYHVSQPWVMLSAFVGGTLFISLPAWRFRTTWFAIIVHGGQSVFFLFLIVGVVLGLA